MWMDARQRAQQVRGLEARLDPCIPIERPGVIPGTHGHGTAERHVLLAGPWVGELGVAMIRWVPYLRHLRRAHPHSYFIASGYANWQVLYADFCDEYWILPDQFQQELLNRETSFNYGALHHFCGNDSYREHALRKGLPITPEVHERIALMWLREAERRRFATMTLVMKLGNERAFEPLRASDPVRARAGRLLAACGADPTVHRIVMMLPRCRLHQSQTRGWPPEVYEAAITTIARQDDLALILLGSPAHEGQFVGYGRQFSRLVNLIGEGLEQQLAFWELADLGTGPPTGGLVPGYLTRTPLLHWYKPGQFPTRHGVPFHQSAEQDYAIFGIRSRWIEVPEAPAVPERLLQQIRTALERITSGNTIE